MWGEVIIRKMVGKGLCGIFFGGLGDWLIILNDRILSIFSGVDA
jgi:hypothetical protein